MMNIMTLPGIIAGGGSWGSSGECSVVAAGRAAITGYRLPRRGLGSDFRKNIIDIFDEDGPFLDETVRSPRARLVDTARYGKDISTLFQGDSCRNEGTAFFGCLNNHNPQ